MGTIGDLCELTGERTFQWNIKNFLGLPAETDAYYESAKFYFCGTSWVLRMFPNGETDKKSKGSIGLYLSRMSNGLPLTVEFSLCIQTAHERAYFETYIKTFNKRKKGSGTSNFLLRSQLSDKKSELLPSDVFTIICVLKNSEAVRVAGSLFNQLLDASDNLLETYAQSSDFKLKFRNENKYDNKVIVEKQTHVSDAMTIYGLNENQDDEIVDIDSLTTQNAFNMYATADKSNRNDVKKLCVEFIIQNLSVEWVCDVIKFAELYQEKEIRHYARKFFKRNADKILECENWKSFVKDNHELSVDLLCSLVKKLLRK